MLHQFKGMSVTTAVYTLRYQWSKILTVPRWVKCNDVTSKVETASKSLQIIKMNLNMLKEPGLFANSISCCYQSFGSCLFWLSDYILGINLTQGEKDQCSLFMFKIPDCNIRD